MVLVADEWHACGVDVAAPEQLSFSAHLPLLDRLRSLPDCFSDAEVCVSAEYAVPHSLPVCRQLAHACVELLKCASGQYSERVSLRMCVRAAALHCNTLARLQFAQAEAHAARGDELLEHYFRHLWSAKEAVLKARGDGLTFAPRLASFVLPRLLPLPSSLPAGTPASPSTRNTAQGLCRPRSAEA